MNRQMRWLWALALAGWLAGCGGQAPATVESSAATVPAGERSVQPAEAAPAAVVVGGLPDFTPLVDAYGPAVVNVTTVARRQAAQQGGPELSPDDPLYEFFRRFGFGAPRAPHPPVRGEGSGFVISADGYIAVPIAIQVYTQIAPGSY